MVRRLGPGWLDDVGLGGELWRLWLSALSGAKRQAAWLAAAGLPTPTADRQRAWLRGRAPMASLLGVLPVRACRGGRWQPAEDGTLSVIQPVTATGEPGEAEPIDLLAWPPDRPGDVLQLRGLARWLGEAAPPPLLPEGWQAVVVTDPRRWLARPGTWCLLDWSPASVMALSWALGPELVFDDVDTAELFEARVRAALMPRLRVEAAA